MPNELPRETTLLIEKSARDRVEIEIDKRIALWSKLVFGTTTISLLGIGALLFAAYESVRSSATSLVRQEVTERVDQTMKSMDLPNVIVKQAATIAQEATTIAAQAKVAAEGAKGEVDKVLAQSKLLDGGQKALKVAVGKQQSNLGDIEKRISDVEKLDSKKLADKAVELDKLMKDNPNAEKLATLLNVVQNKLNVNLAVVEAQLTAPRHPTHRFYPLTTNGVGKNIDKVITEGFPKNRQVEAGDTFGSEVVACWIDVPAYLHNLYKGPGKWSRLDARIVDGNHVEIVTSGVDGVPDGIECRVFVVYKN